MSKKSYRIIASIRDKLAFDPAIFDITVTLQSEERSA